MIDIAAATAAIGTISSVVDLSDKVWNSWLNFKSHRTISTNQQQDHGEKISARAGDKELVHSSGGIESKVVTREELAANLTQQDLDFLEALETRMTHLTRKWTVITSEIELTVDAQIRSTYELQLEDLAGKIGQILKQITDFLSDLGFSLLDHYSAMRSISAN